ncbi:hypothetical protein AY606_05885 [Acinetobacter sp. SFB]|uniref:hypothetical protein n=1 Tax=Acinetobacter sp. SFB TaxID=1805634 RepID=UPI0007D822E9|nr:hypothetical protein [Acinetobacter sp. SFB]OAL78956.1 hypothetical protein AY606_05885 [Acinetobacter sp. SFB]
MNLTETPESIVPGQSEIDSWPQLKRTSHPCQDKCSNFKDEECGHCLVKHEPVLQNADEAKYYRTYLEANRYAP